MKRFIFALIILVITLSSSAILNINIQNSTNEIIKMIENDCESQDIKIKWEKDKFLYSLIFTQSDIEEIQILFDNICDNKEEVYSEIKEELTLLKDSTKLNVENIF